MKNFRSALIACTFLTLVAGTAHADTVVFNGTPAAGWDYGTGNDYVPANTAVLTTDAGDQLFLRTHETFKVAPASIGNTYNFATGTSPLSFDWGFTHIGSLDGVSALITISKMGGGSFSYDPLAPGNDNTVANNSVENSGRFNWFPINFDGTGQYSATLSLSGFSGGAKELTVNANLGGAVPEPASWALMIAGFGATGAMLRRRRSLALA